MQNECIRRTHHTKNFQYQDTNVASTLLFNGFTVGRAVVAVVGENWWFLIKQLVKRNRNFFLVRSVPETVIVVLAVFQLMRHYAPHHTHFQTWASPARNAVHRPSTATLRERISSIISQFRPSTESPSSPLPSTPPPSPNASFSSLPQDDLNVEPRLSALHRWLNLTTPLSDAERRALRTLMRNNAVIIRSREASQCIVCSQPLESKTSLMASPNSPFLLGTSIFVQMVTFLLRWMFFMFTFLSSRLHRFRQHLERRRLLHIRRMELTRNMHSADCYSAWYSAAETLDLLDGNHAWMTEARSSDINDLCNECDSYLNAVDQTRQRAKDIHRVLDDIDTVFDVDMLSAKLRELSLLYRKGDIRGLAFALRASLIRNFGGMCHPRLHSHSRVGTDSVVEDYVYVVSFLLAFVAQAEHHVSHKLSEGTSRSNDPSGSKDIHSSSTLTRMTSSHNSSTADLHVDDPSTLSIDDKLTFLNEARHAYGRTALMLSGGAVMGLHHFGIVKGLLTEDLLPRVVCGTSAGALVASIVGILNDEELSTLLNTDEFLNPITNQPFVFRFFKEPCTWRNRYLSFVRTGFLEDVSVLQEALQLNYGDLTFQEAYDKTGRILNITVCPTRSSSDPPLLLNYLTAPHVLIWSAASASCAIPWMFQAVELVAKSANGRLVPYHSDGSLWSDGSISSDVPLARIGELFNVNHFIVSQTNPHVIPRSFAILHTRLAVLIKSELQFRYWQALQMGLVPRLLSSIFPHFMQPYAGDVTIMPDIRLSDLSMLMHNPTTEMLKDFMKRGEVQTYPYIDCIRLHCSIERALDKCVEYVATMAKEDGEARSSSPDRSGLFGGVPSWLWLDKRSILSKAGVNAMASRLSKGLHSEQMKIVLETMPKGKEKDTKKGTEDGSRRDGNTVKRRQSRTDTKPNSPDNNLNNVTDSKRDASGNIDALVDALHQDISKRSSFQGSRSNDGLSSDQNDSFSDLDDGVRVIC